MASQKQTSEQRNGFLQPALKSAKPRSPPESFILFSLIPFTFIFKVQVLVCETPKQIQITIILHLSRYVLLCIFKHSAYQFVPRFSKYCRFL